MPVYLARSHQADALLDPVACVLRLPRSVYDALYYLHAFHHRAPRLLWPSEFTSVHYSREKVPSHGV